MSAVFDIIIIAVMAVSIISGWRAGFVKTVMGFVSVFVAFFAALFLSPFVGSYICESFLIEPISKEISETLTSLLSVTGDGAARTTAQLFADMPESLTAMLERFGVDEAGFTSKFMSNSPATSSLVSEMAENIARPACEMIGLALAFFLIFVIASVILKIATVIIGAVVELPALKQLNTALGIALGVVCALFYAVILSNVFVHLADALAIFDPAMFSDNLIEKTHIVKLCSELRLSMVTELIEAARTKYSIK